MPPPPSDTLALGPVEVGLYGLLLLGGLVVWIAVTARLWERGGGDGASAAWLCVLAAPPVLIGARLYSVLTDLEQYRGDPGAVLDLAGGGIGIYGGVAAGVLALWVGVASRGWPVGTFFDCAVPGLALGQAIGRWGDYVDQQRYGGPSALPWALEVEPAYRPIGLEDVATFHPTFLYESLWCVTVFGLLGVLWRPLTRRFRPGAVLATYLTLYGVGRFAIEGLRTDPAIAVGPLRLDQVVSLGVMATGFLLHVLLDRHRRPRR